MSRTQVAVVAGGGASGVLAAIELQAAGWRVALIDPHARAGHGVAYRAMSKRHVLNSPVSTMSALNDSPDDFLRWCRSRCPGTQPSDFVPRSWYSDYLSDTLRRTDSGTLMLHRATVSRVFETGGGYAVLLSDGVVMPASHVVLALGHSPPGDPFPMSAEVRRSRAYVADPWQPGSLAGQGTGPVLLIGTGLTAYNVALTLAHDAPGAAMVAVSRHGLTPQPHFPGGTPAAQAGVEGTGPLSQVMRQLRRLASGGEEWRSVMDAHRPHWNNLWQRMPEPDQRRFLDHAARFWETHRHRVAPAVAEEIASLRANKVLEVRAGEVCGLAAHPSGGLTAVLRDRQGITTQRFATVVNCTGPGRLVDSSPLVRSLMAEGLARPGPYRLGLDTDAHGALVRRDGSVSSSMWTLGPPRRGVLWETTAVPEIRAQARVLAKRLGRKPVTATTVGPREPGLTSSSL